MIKYILIIIGIIISIILTDIELLFQYNFFLLAAYLIITFLSERFLRLYHVWIFAFIYIVIPEGVIDAELISIYGESGVMASKYICLANWLVLLAHTVAFNRKATSIIQPGSVIYEKGPLTFGFLLILLVSYLIVIGPIAIKSFLYGRVNVEGNTSNLPVFISSFINSSGFVLPALIAYYYKYLNKNKYYFLTSLLISLPIFILLFIAGTRFPLLFSLGGFILMHFIGENISLGRIIKVAPGIVLIVILAGKMKEFRTFGVAESTTSIFDAKKKTKDDDNFFDFGSIEGVVVSNAKLVDYFDTHDHMMGLSNSFILYFWIPRSLWPDKPQMLGYWFIRDYDDINHDSGHNASFSFAGDAYADFGFAGGLIFCVLLGFLLAKFDEWIKEKLKYPEEFPAVIATLSYSYVFFIVRSPQTSTFNFLGILAVYFVIKKTLSIRIKNHPNETSVRDKHSRTLSEQAV